MRRAGMLIISAVLTLSSTVPVAQGVGRTSAVDKALSQFARFGKSRVHYKSLGRGDTALVFVHGWTCDLTFWGPQVPAFEGNTRILLIDLPGHGRSDKPQADYTLDFMARGVDAVLLDAGVETAVLVGHSMGVSVVHQFYRLFPKKTRALVAADGSLSFTESDAAETKKFADSLAGPAFTQLQSKLIDSFFTDKTPTDLRQAAKATMARTRQHVAASAMKGMANQTSWKTPIEVPVQVIIARNGPFWSADYENQTRQLAPRMRYHSMQGVGHFLMLENPKEFNQVLGDFLRTQGLLRP